MFVSVKVAMILLLFELPDLDMLVCVCTCPYQSWQNVAERVISTLNLALSRSLLNDEDSEKSVYAKKNIEIETGSLLISSLEIYLLYILYLNCITKATFDA